jgi:hypothetical protein
MPITFPSRENQPELPPDFDGEHVEHLIEGAVDLHVHPFPSPFPRRMGIMEAAADASRAKYRAMIAKSHHHSMVPDILALHEVGLGDLPVKVFGGVALNNHVGGLNPYAVDLALNMGGRIVWFPTLASPAHIAHVEEEQSHGRAGFVQSTITLRKDAPISILDEEGRLKPEAIEILEMIKEHDVILTGGHLPAAEIDVLIKQAVRVGVDRLLVNHPQFVVGASPELAAEWAGLGVYIEHSTPFYTTTFGRRKAPLPISDLLAYITAVGVDRTILVSDTGQKDNIRPVDAIREIISLLIENGYDDAAIKRMTGDNAADLLLKESDG